MMITVWPRDPFEVLARSVAAEFAELPEELPYFAPAPLPPRPARRPRDRP